jgi:hypothetical protein
MVNLLGFFSRILEPAVEASMPMAVDGVLEPHEIGDQVARRCEILRLRLPRRFLFWVDSIANLNARLAENAQRGCIPSDSPALITSPSDFGPHNLLKTAGGDAYRVVDLEFFGLDEAHKLVGDTLLHPQNQWSDLTLQPFFSSAAYELGLHSGRLEAFLPLLSLKWATIVLAKMGGVGFRPGVRPDERNAGTLGLEWYLEFAKVGDLDMGLHLLETRTALFQSTSR